MTPGSHSLILFLTLGAVVATAAPGGECKGDRASDACQPHAAAGPSTESLLLQVRAGDSALKRVNGSRARDSETSCARTLRRYDRRNAACIVIREDKALLVRVPYGSSPGWDLPGGCKHSNEYACETAEREVCEETGFEVKAVAQLSYNVFKCEVLRENACKKPVDEGFLQKEWFPLSAIEGLQYRGHTWGDKKGLLKKQLRASSGSDSGREESDEVDVCGCKMCEGEGFSTRRHGCARGSRNEVGEACECLKRSENPEGVDSCGCKSCQGEGWSSRRGRCVEGSHTEPQEACQCKKKEGA